MSIHRQTRTLLFLSTPVGPLGSGLGGGVELTILNVARELSSVTTRFTVKLRPSQIASLESVPKCVEIPGQLQNLRPILRAGKRPTVLPVDAVLANMWHYAQAVQENVDLIVNFAYDWLPFYLTPFFENTHCPLRHHGFP